MNQRIRQFRYGLKDGVPIGLGYLAVSFSFGIMARKAGVSTLAAVIMSLTNLTSAGQFAALGIIEAGAPFVEMAAAQLIINLRYCLMSCSLSQKLEKGMPFLHRFMVSYGVTDEIFGVSVCREGSLSPFYTYGLICVAVPGWTFGTFLGAVSGDLLPARLLSALGVALYGMFLAVVIPPARESRILAGVYGGQFCVFSRSVAERYIVGFQDYYFNSTDCGGGGITFSGKRGEGITGKKVEMLNERGWRI